MMCFYRFGVRLEIVWSQTMVCRMFCVNSINIVINILKFLIKIKLGVSRLDNSYILSILGTFN